MEFTQEQLAEIERIKTEAIASARVGLFTEDELNRRVTSEVDRRVESGIQKGLETQRVKWEDDFKKKQNMTAEEIAAEKIREKETEITTRESQVRRKSNEVTAKEALADAGIPKAHYEKFLSVLVTDDETGTLANVENFVAMINETKTGLETSIKESLTKIIPPKLGDQNQTATKEQFNKMGYAEKVKFKAEQPELYKQFMNS